MKMRNIKIDEERVREVSFRNKEEGDGSVARSMAYLTDNEKKKRLEAQQCKCCFYLHGSYLAGQAFTDWNCGVCDKEQSHPNTATPKVCTDCSKKHALCIRCGGDVHGRAGRPTSVKID